MRFWSICALAGLVTAGGMDADAQEAAAEPKDAERVDPATPIRKVYEDIAILGAILERELNDRVDVHEAARSRDRGVYLRDFGIVYDFPYYGVEVIRKAILPSRSMSEPTSELLWDRVRGELARQSLNSTASKAPREPPLADRLLRALAENAANVAVPNPTDRFSITVRFDDNRNGNLGCIRCHTGSARTRREMSSLLGGIYGVGSIACPVTLKRASKDGPETTSSKAGTDDQHLDKKNDAPPPPPPLKFDFDFPIAKEGDPLTPSHELYFHSLFAKEGDPSTAKQTSSEAALKSKARNLQRLGDLHARNGRMQEALDAYRKALKIERSGNESGMGPMPQALDSSPQPSNSKSQGKIAEGSNVGSPSKRSAAMPTIALSQRLIVTVVAENAQLFHAGEIDFDEFKKRAHVEFHDFTWQSRFHPIDIFPQPIGAGR